MAKGRSGGPADVHPASPQPHGACLAEAANINQLHGSAPAQMHLRADLQKNSTCCSVLHLCRIIMHLIAQPRPSEQAQDFIQQDRSLILIHTLETAVTASSEAVQQSPCHAAQA